MVVPVSKPKVSSGEMKYRKDLFPDVKEITKNKNLVCTSCSGSVKDLITKGKPISHPFLETLLCEKCCLFYGDGEFSVDEDGSDKYCRWCGQGGTLFLCSKCTAGFCKKCVKRNLPRSALNEIEDDDWECYCCNTQPLYELRAHCWAAKQYAEDLDLKVVKDKSSSKSRKPKDNKRSRESSIDEDDEEKKPQSKKKKHKESSSDEAANDDEDNRRSKKRRKNDSRRSDRKSDRKNENGDTEKERPSKDKKNRSSKEDEVNENTDNESAISSKLTSDYKKKINDFITDYALITKDCHKKILLFKTKKMNLNAVEDVKNLHSSIKEVLNSYFTAGKEVLKVFDEHTEAFVNELDGRKDKNGTKKTDSSEIEKNTIENNRDVLDASEPEKEKSVEPITAEKVTTDNGEKTDDKTSEPMETNESDRKSDSENLGSGSGDASKIDKELEDGLDKNPDNPATEAGVKDDDTTSEKKNSKSLDVSSSEPSNKDQSENSKS